MLDDEQAVDADWLAVTVSRKGAIAIAKSWQVEWMRDGFCMREPARKSAHQRKSSQPNLIDRFLDH